LKQVRKIRLAPFLECGDSSPLFGPKKGGDELPHSKKAPAPAKDPPGSSRSRFAESSTCPLGNTVLH